MKILVVVSKRNNNMWVEQILPIYKYLIFSGHNCKLSIHNKDNNIDYSKVNMLCLGIFFDVKLRNLPKKYIIWNCDTFDSIICSDKKYQKKLRRAKMILHYNKYDLDKFRKYNKRIKYLPFCYHRFLENIYKLKLPIKKDIDVLFMGTSIVKKGYGVHRINVLNNLSKKGLNIHITGRNGNKYVYMKERDYLIQRSKIILLINYYEHNVDTCRPTYLLTNKCFVIGDSWGNGDKLREIYGDTFPIVNSDKLYETIIFYLNNKNERNKVIDKSYNFVKNNLYLRKYMKQIKL